MRKTVGKDKIHTIPLIKSDSCQFSRVFCVGTMVEKNKKSRASKERLRRQEATEHCVGVDDPDDSPEVFEINKEEESKEEVFAADSARMLRDTNINVRCRKGVLVTHDESTFYRRQERFSGWRRERKQSNKPQSAGSSIMIIGFMSGNVGFMQKKNSK